MQETTLLPIFGVKSAFSFLEYFRRFQKVFKSKIKFKTIKFSSFVFSRKIYF